MDPDDDSGRPCHQCLEKAGDAAAQWAATAHRRPLAHVVDLYELGQPQHTCARHRGICRAGRRSEQPGLLLSETAEDAITILYEGLQRIAGILEGARPRPLGDPPPQVSCTSGSSVTPCLTVTAS